VRRCEDCEFYSATHGMCFELTTWSQGEVGQIPGDPQMINRDGKCRLFESVHPRLWRCSAKRTGGLDMLRFKVSQFFRRFR